MFNFFKFLKPNLLLEKRESKYNGTIEVWKSWGLGTYITVGGLTQSGGILHAIWKSTLRKIRRTNPEIRNCLILGLGGGTAAKWVKYFWPNAKITGVEIDPTMVDLGKKYLELGDSQTEVVVGDAFIWLMNKSQRPKVKYDLIIVDLYVGNKIPEKLKSEEFLKLLTGNKIVVFNRVFFKGRKKEALEFGEKLKKHFSKVDYFYPTANLMIICKKDWPICR